MPSPFSLISTDQIKEISGLENRVNVRVIGVDLESLNEGIISGCAIVFENEDRSFVLSLTVTVSDSERTAQSKYGEVFSASHQMGFEVIEGNNGPWIYHMVEINERHVCSSNVSEYAFEIGNVRTDTIPKNNHIFPKFIKK